MAILQKIQNIARGLLGRRVSSLIFGTSTREVYADINVKNAIDKGFNSNTAIYSIVSKAAKKFGSIPRYLNSTTDVKVTIDNDLSKLINRPNEYQGQDAFLSAVYAYYKICGEAFIWLNRGNVAMTVDDNGNLLERSDVEMDRMPVLEMYVLPSDKMVAVPDPENLYGVLGWILDLGGKRIQFRKGDIIHWKNINLDFDAGNRTHLRGLPPLTPGYKTLQQNNDGTNAAVRMYQNDGAKGMLFNETFNKVTPTQQTQIEKVVDSKINNNDAKGAVVTLQGKWGYANFGGTSVDMELLKGKEMSWKELCFLFGVPYEFFDSQVTYENKEKAQIGWITNEIIPDSKQLDDELNRALLKAFKISNAKIECDHWDLPEMQDVKRQTAEALSKLWPIVPNEVREALGYEKRKEPEFDEPWIPSGYTPLSQLDQMGDEQIKKELTDIYDA